MEANNNAKMREALVAMVEAETDGTMERDDLCGRCLEKLWNRCTHDGSCWVDKVMGALAEPIRNCDRFCSGNVEKDADDAMRAMLDEMRSDGNFGFRGIASYLLSPMKRRIYDSYDRRI